MGDCWWCGGWLGSLQKGERKKEGCKSSKIRFNLGVFEKIDLNTSESNAVFCGFGLDWFGLWFFIGLVWF